MKVSLRKANAIVTNLQEELKETKLVTSIKLNEFRDPAEVMDEAAKALNAALEKKTVLLTRIFAIRKIVGAANQTSGINDVLTDLASVAKGLELMQEVGTAVRMNSEEIVGKIAKLKTVGNDVAYYMREGVETSILKQEDVDETLKVIAALKKKKQELQDKLLHLNVTTEVEIGDIG
jgi:predicted DNA-binding protein